MDGETATVTQQFYIEVEVGEKKNSFSDKEAFLLRKEGRYWKILKGL